MDPDSPGAASSPWTPPDAGRPAPPPPPGGPQVQTDDAGGPPLPPPLRARRRRRRIILAVVAALALIAIPVGLAVAGAGFFTLEAGDGLAADDGTGDDGTGDDGTGDDGTGDGEAGDDGTGDGEAGDAGTDDGEADGDAGDDDATGDDETGSDGGPDADGSGPDDPIGGRPGVSPSLDAPDPALLEGTDALYAALLIDVDRSENVMIGFQEDVAEAFGAIATDDDLIGTLRTIATERRDELLDVRAELDVALDDDGADQVRQRYLAHLDSWADYMDAVADDPQLLAGEGMAGGFTVVINQTADAFARALDEQLPLDADGEVQDFAEGILERGFRSDAEAQV